MALYSGNTQIMCTTFFFLTLTAQCLSDEQKNLIQNCGTHRDRIRSFILRTYKIYVYCIHYTDKFVMRWRENHE